MRRRRKKKKKKKKKKKNKEKKRKISFDFLIYSKSKTSRRCLLESSFVDEKEAMFSCRLLSQKRGSTYATSKLSGDPKLSINPRKEYDFKEALKDVASSGKSATSHQKAKYPGERALSLTDSWDTGSPFTNKPRGQSNRFDPRMTHDLQGFVEKR